MKNHLLCQKYYYVQQKNFHFYHLGLRNRLTIKFLITNSLIIFKLGSSPVIIFGLLFLKSHVRITTYKIFYFHNQLTSCILTNNPEMMYLQKSFDIRCSKGILMNSVYLLFLTSLHFSINLSDIYNIKCFYFYWKSFHF